MDAIEDTELAIGAYERAEYNRSIDGLYLATYGVLQALFTQQDAVLHLAEALGIRVDVKKYPELSAIRDIRNRSIGHPTKRDDKKGTSFNFISQVSLTPQGFKLMSVYNDNVEINDITTTALIADQRKYVQQILSEVRNQILTEDEAHHRQFREDKLRSIFHNLEYCCEKMAAACRHNNDVALGRWGFEAIQRSLAEFKDKLRARGLDVKTYPGVEQVFDELEYPLQRVDDYFNGTARVDQVLLDQEATVFVEYLSSRLDSLKQLADDIDQEYEG